MTNNKLPELIMTCPMCEYGTLEHETAENPQSTVDGKYTHVYICDSCPLVAMEWYNHSDTKAFPKALNTI